MKTNRTWQRTQTGAYLVEHRDPDGRLHRDGAPARILDAPNDYTREQQWFRHGVLHHDGGPATLRGTDNASHADTALWYRNNEQHREGGPAAVWRDGTGEPIREEWWRGNKRHRDDGPAVIWLIDGRGEMDWWKNGEPYAPSAHERLAWAKIQATRGGPFFPEAPVAFHREIARPARVQRARRFEPVL